MTQALTVYRRSQVEDCDCLFRWNAIWNKGVDDSSDFSLRGQAFAHIKHLYVMRLVKAMVPADEEEARAAFIQGIAEHQTPQRLIPELRDLFMRHAEVFELDLQRFVTSEERQTGDGLSFSPDLVYAHAGELEILDDKTFWSALTEVEARQSFQGRFYSHQARLRWPNFRSYRFTFCFVRFNKFVSVVYSQSELDQVDLEIKAAIARLQHAEATQQWPAVAGPSCRYCELLCPIASEQQRIPIRLNAVQAPQVAAWVLTADKMVKGMKKALKAYCSANGPVSVGGIEFDNRPITERKYPVEFVLELLTKRGVAGAFKDDGALTISHSALKPLMKQFPQLEADLASVVQEKQAWRFSAKKPGGDESEDDS